MYKLGNLAWSLTLIKIDMAGSSVLWNRDVPEEFIWRVEQEHVYVYISRKNLYFFAYCRWIW